MKPVVVPGPLPSRQATKRFLTGRAMDFILQSQQVPCTRASRRAAARELAKRFIVNMKAEKVSNESEQVDNG